MRFWLQIIDVTWLILSLCVLAVFALYIAWEIRRYGFGRYRLKGAIAVATVFLGLAIAGGWRSFYRALVSRGSDTAWLADYLWILLIGTVIGTVGTLCLIRVFSPAEWQRWAWVLCAALALSGSIAVASF